jgi:hypothetical protein
MDEGFRAKILILYFFLAFNVKYINNIYVKKHFFIMRKINEKPKFKL